ncbi:DUF4837 family protein [uncultured Tenacibaculum sp.]|uniref:DUF4837 family protein n=1 Tax=uncultured Tenacibaculum sp. TaxID=174713 RepID=UPI00262A3F4F|nr:DUF4837 family protein [uncultured Tenacibaculum sp.]
MKKILTLFIASLTLLSCKQNGKREIILPRSNGNTNSILVVMKGDDWLSKPGDEIRRVFGEHQVGLPQPETLLSVDQIDPSGFSKFIRNNKAVLLFQKGDSVGISTEYDKYAAPQIVIKATYKDEYDLVNIIKNRGKEIIQLFKDQDVKYTQEIFKREKIDVSKLGTVNNLGLDLIIPERYRLVQDTLNNFLWMRQHLKSGIARGDGTNNILIYSLPLGDETKIVDNITAVRDSIGKIFIPGSKEGMYMITEQAYTPFTYETKIDGKKAYETRGKWEVKNDFMAGPFLNYTIVDKKNNRLVVFEGFTYAPSVNKRDFVFELEAIAKSLKIK